MNDAVKDDKPRNTNVPDLIQAASIARGDLASAYEKVEEHVNWKYIQSIRMITNAIGDFEAFKEVWDMWHIESQYFNNNRKLPSYENMMNKDYKD